MSSSRMPRSAIRPAPRGVTVEPGSGNVFEDMGRADAAEALPKAELAHKICELIEAENLSQTAAARRLGVDQPKVSALLRGRLRGFSTDRLLRFLNALNRDVLIVIRPARGRHRGAVRIVAEG